MSEFGTIDTQMLGIPEDQIKDVDDSEAEVVSRVLTSRIKDIVVAIRPDSVTFNATCVRSMVDVKYIQILIDRPKHRMYVAPAEQFDKDSHQWCNVKDGKRISRKITGRDLGTRIYKLMGWSKGYTYRVTGYPAKQIGTESEYLLVFEMDEFDRRLLTEKALIGAGVDDADLGADAAQIHADIAKEKEEKEKAREAAKNGRKKRARTKTEFFGAVEDGAFGVPKKDHVDHIVVPMMEQLEVLSEEEKQVSDPATEDKNPTIAAEQMSTVTEEQDSTAVETQNPTVTEEQTSIIPSWMTQQGHED